MKNYFELEELVPNNILKWRGSASIELLDPNSIIMLNSVRVILDNPMTINNYTNNGNRTQSGLRTREFYSNDSAYFKSLSQHKFGRAFDALLGKKLSVKNAIKHIIRNHKHCPFVSFIEIDQSWLHIDNRKNRDGSKLRLWSPSRGYVNTIEFLKE